MPVSRSAQRWAREPRPYAPSRTHCTGRTGSSAPTTLFVGADAYIGPTGYFPHPRQGTRALPYKIALCRAAPLMTDAGRRGRRPLRNPIGKHSVGADASVRPPIPYRPSCKSNVIARAHRARGNPHPPSPRPPCLKGAVRRGGVLPRRNFPAAPHCKSPAKGVYCPHQHQAE